MIRMTSGSEDWGYVYTADDERIWMYNIAANTSRWTLRDLGGKVLREYLNNGAWSVGTDYIYRDGLLLAAETQTGQRHFHLDHLGTPRLITRAGGERVAYHVYYPFGEEATAFNQDSERMKFTGHERDLASATGPGDDLDYMHARHESPVTGRFVSPDPSQQGQDPKAPRSWNRYAYALGNPLKYVDPDGRTYRCPPAGCPEWMTPHTFWQRLEKGFNEASMLPGPMALEAVPGAAGSLISRFSQFFSRLFGGGEGAAEAAELAGRFSVVEGRASVLQKVIRPDGGLNVSETVGKQLMGVVAGKNRQFIPAQSILDAIGSGTRVADPQDIANQFLYTAKAVYNGSQGS